MPAFRTSAAGGSSTGTSDRTAIITPAVGDLLLVFCAVDTNTNSTPTCSDNNGSGTYDRIAALAFGSSAHRGSLFIRTALMANTTSTTVTVATGSNTAGEVVVVAVSGMVKAGIGAIRSSGSQANQAAGTPAPALNQTALTGNVTIGAVFNSTNPATMTTPTGWTERQDVGQTANAVGLEVVTRDSGFTGTTVTWGSASASAFASAIIELDGSNSGTLAKTIAAVTSNPNATGTVKIQGVESGTIDAVTAGGTGAVVVQGSESSTIAAVAVTGTGTVSNASASGASGALNATIDPVISAATGTVAVRGAVSAQVAAVATVAAGAVHVSGATSATIAAITGAAAGAVHVAGAGAGAISVPVISASGAVHVTGAASAAAGNVTLDAQGVGYSGSSGALAVTINAPTLVATGAVASIPTPTKAPASGPFSSPTRSRGGFSRITRMRRVRR